ncbi:MAG: four helix bundle protein [Marinoscillum sp.]|jgi:four helix bundle protein
MIEEAGQAESKADFIHKLSIANKEANETSYWLRLLRDFSVYEKEDIQLMLDQVEELIKMLVASIKTAKSK